MRYLVRSFPYARRSTYARDTTTSCMTNDTLTPFDFKLLRTAGFGEIRDS